MTELSLPWDGTATGDAGTYTDDEWRDVLRSVSGGGGAFGQQKTLGSYNEGNVGVTLTFDLTIPKGQCPMYGVSLYDFEYE